MFTTRIIDEKEKERYNKFVVSHNKGHFLQLWEWGQIKKYTGWEPLYLVLEENGEIRGTLLILKRKLPIPGLTKSIFYSPRGPVINIEDEESCQRLFEGARKVAQENGAIFLKIDPDIRKENHSFRHILSQCGFKKNETGQNFEGVQPNFVYQLDITPSEINILNNMHSKTRYNIRLAKRKGVIVRLAEDKDDLRSFYQVLIETAQRDKFLVRNFEYFEQIWDYMIGEYAQVFLAEYEGQIIAGTLALKTGQKAWYLYGASSNNYRNVMPNYFLQWEMIRWAKKNSCSIYDFRGVSGDMDENNPLYGLYRFKKGFNGELVEFIGEWDKVYSALFYFLWNRALPLYTKITHQLSSLKK